MNGEIAFQLAVELKHDMEILDNTIKSFWRSLDTDTKHRLLKIITALKEEINLLASVGV